MGGWMRIVCENGGVSGWVGEWVELGGMELGGVVGRRGG